MSNEPDFIEQQLRESAAPLPPHLRHRVLDCCAAKAPLRTQRNRRANWRLAWGFAAVCVLHYGVGGMLDAQQQNMLGYPASSGSSLYAANQNGFHRSVLLRSRLIAELSDPRHDFS
jgi:hypothetical protein